MKKHLRFTAILLALGMLSACGNGRPTAAEAAAGEVETTVQPASDLAPEPATGELATESSDSTTSTDGTADPNETTPAPDAAPDPAATSTSDAQAR